MERELRSYKKTELSSRYALLVSQCIQMWKICIRRVAEDLAE